MGSPTVVREGCTIAASAMSSKPITLSSAGTAMPRALHRLSRPSAMTSL
jgi:hypothetical protein